MFILREFVKKGFLEAVGNMPTYKIILNATGWYEKGLLTEEDLAEINTAIYPEADLPEGAEICADTDKEHEVI